MPRYIVRIKEKYSMVQEIHFLSLSLSPEERYRAMFVRAMEAWKEATCIEFELAEHAEVDHLVFIKSDDLG